MQASKTGYKVDKTSKCVSNYGPCTVESENREFATKTVVRPIFHIFSLMFVHADGCFALCVSQFTQFRTPISHPFFANYRFAFRRMSRNTAHARCGVSSHRSQITHSLSVHVKLSYRIAQV